jgi:hypothetical protein
MIMRNIYDGTGAKLLTEALQVWGRNAMNQGYSLMKFLAVSCDRDPFQV